jgi:PadR family transcriptional regulator PadR
VPYASTLRDFGMPLLGFGQLHGETTGHVLRNSGPRHATSELLQECNEACGIDCNRASGAWRFELCWSDPHLLLSQREYGTLPVGNPNDNTMKEKTDVPQGTLALMVLKTLDVLGPQHGYGIARRIEQISGDLLAVNQGTLYPVLLKLEQEGAIASEWGASENNRRARFYRLTREGRKQLQVETQDWEQTAAIIARFFEAKAEDLS